MGRLRSPHTQTTTEKHDDIQHQHTQTPNIRRIPDVPGQPHRCRGTGPGRGWRRRDAVHGHQRPKEDGLDQGVMSRSFRQRRKRRRWEAAKQKVWNILTNQVDQSSQNAQKKSIEYPIDALTRSKVWQLVTKI